MPSRKTSQRTRRRGPQPKRKVAPAAKVATGPPMINSLSIKNLFDAEHAHYTDACAIARGLLTPHLVTDPEAIPSFGLSGPVNHVSPKTVVNLHLGSGTSSVPFSCLVYPQTNRSVWTTDLIAQAPNLFVAERLFEPAGYPCDRTNPPGRLEQGAFSCTGGSIELDFSNEGDTVRAYNHYDPEIFSGSTWWMSDLGVRFSKPTNVTVNVAGNFAGALVEGRFKANTPTDAYDLVGTLLLPEDGTVVTYTLNNVQSLDSFGLRITPAEENEVEAIHDVNVTLSFRSVSGQEPAIVSPYLLYNQPSDLFNQLQNIAEVATVLGLEATLTYSGSSLNDGGVVAARRLVSNLAPLAAPQERYEELAAIPGAYNDKLKTGAWVHWIPENLSSFEGRTIYYNDRRSECLAISGQIDDPTQRLTLTVRSLVRFTTLSRMYAQEHAALNPAAWALVMSVLRHMNSACCNPDHVARMKKILSTLYEHRGSIKDGAHTALSAARKLAPVVAALML